MTVLLVVNGEIYCPKKAWARVARDACCAEQARVGPGCGYGCERGAAALREAAAFREEEAREESVRQAVRQRHAGYYRRYGALPSQQKPRTGRPRGRPPRPRPPKLPKAIHEWWR